MNIFLSLKLNRSANMRLQQRFLVTLIVIVVLLVSYLMSLCFSIEPDVKPFFDHLLAREKPFTIRNEIETLNNQIHSNENTFVIHGPKAAKERIYELPLQPINKRLQEALISSNKTVHDPKSPFYGLQYKDTYGFPLSDFGIPSFKQNEKDWKIFFPDIAMAFENYQKNNPTQDAHLATHFFTVSLHKANYSLGDELVATVQARDARGKAKTFGGDYLRARLVRDTSRRPKDGIACRVVDHGNGTYTIKAPIVHKGQMMLDVELILPSEALYELNKEQTTAQVWSSRNFYGTLTTGEVVYCSVNLKASKKLKYSPMCDYSNPRNRGPWFCLVPPSGNCSPIRNIHTNRTRTLDAVNAEQISKKYLTQGRFQRKIYVHESLRDRHNLTDHHLPVCNDLYSKASSISSVSGYISNSSWISLQCKPPLGNRADALKDRIVYMFGDSTTRLLYFQFVIKYGLKNIEFYPSNYWIQPRLAYSLPNSSNTNLTFYYRAHGLPMTNGGPSETMPYISDSVIGIPAGGKGVYIVINIGPHFVGYYPTLFIHRAKEIKKAVSLHHKNFPETRFIIKGLNVVKGKNWNTYRFEVILRKMFENMRNVIFLNFWELTTIWHQDNVHPDQATQNIEETLMLNFLL